MVDGLAPALGRLDEHLEVVLDPVLADELVEAYRPDRGIELKVSVKDIGYGYLVSHCMNCLFYLSALYIVVIIASIFMGENMVTVRLSLA